MTNCQEARAQEAHRGDALKAGAGLMLAAGVGAGLMYFLDPNRGRARRAMARDKAAKLLHEGVEETERAIQDIENRAVGLAHEAEALLHSTEPVDDETLVARVRAKLGRLVSRPHRVGVTSVNGHITLAGQVRPSEADGLVLAVRAMAGVKEVENRLEMVVQANEVKSSFPRLLAELAALAGFSTLLLSQKPR